MDDEQLEQLALTAKRHPPGSPERQKALNQLTEAICKSIDASWRSGKLRRLQYRWLQQGYTEEIFREALQDLLLYIFQNIDRYDPDRYEPPKRTSVMKWCIFLLKKRFRQAAFTRIVGRRDIPIVSLENLDNLSSPEASPDLAKEIKNYIELDPDNIFNRTSIENHPEANFSAISMLYLEGKPWREISEIFGIPISTLSSFYQRSLRQFVPSIREYLDENI